MVPEDEIRQERQQNEQPMGSGHRKRGRRSGRGRRGGRGRRPGAGPPQAQERVAQEDRPAAGPAAEEAGEREEPATGVGAEETRVTTEREYEEASHREPHTAFPPDEAPSSEHETEDLEERQPRPEVEIETEPHPEQRADQDRLQSARGQQHDPQRRVDFRPAAPQSIQEALEQTNDIIETLRATLEDMEEVLETLELAERQKDADEREIEALRRSLRQLHRPREGGSHRH